MTTVVPTFPMTTGHHGDCEQRVMGAVPGADRDRDILKANATMNVIH